MLDNPHRVLCQHCGKDLYGHAAFARCAGGQTQYTPAEDRPILDKKLLERLSVCRFCHQRYSQHQAFPSGLCFATGSPQHFAPLDPPFYQFPSIESLQDHLKKQEYVYYQAPLDHRPVLVYVRQYTINNWKPERSRITIEATQEKPIGPLVVALNLCEHLTRFRFREDK